MPGNALEMFNTVAIVGGGCNTLVTGSPSKEAAVQEVRDCDAKPALETPAATTSDSAFSPSSTLKKKDSQEDWPPITFEIPLVYHLVTFILRLNLVVSLICLVGIAVAVTVSYFNEDSSNWRDLLIRLGIVMAVTVPSILFQDWIIHLWRRCKMIGYLLVVFPAGAALIGVCCIVERFSVIAGCLCLLPAYFIMLIVFRFEDYQGVFFSCNGRCWRCKDGILPAIKYADVSWTCNVCGQKHIWKKVG
jgi:hypothetical protein